MSDAAHVAEITGLSFQASNRLLQLHKGDVDAAVSAHFNPAEALNEGHETATSPTPSSLNPVDSILDRARENAKEPREGRQ